MKLFLAMVVADETGNEEKQKLNIDEAIFTRIADNDMAAYEEF